LAAVESDGLGVVVVLHLGFFTSADVDGSVGVTVHDFARDEEVFFADFLSTLAHSTGEVCLRLDWNLHSLIHTETVNVEALDPHAGEVVDLCQNAGLPVTKTILDTTELGQLLHPFGVCTESADITKLVEVTVHAALELGHVHIVVLLSILIPELRERNIAVFFKIVRLLEIPVHIFSFVVKLVFVEVEGRTGVLVSVESEHVGHGCEGVLDDNVHASCVDGIDGGTSLRDVTEMVIENGQIEGTETV
jgi:hypothetical protein